ncbi:MAG TPA: hypothetical protein VGX78_17010 [Pirellulales bacterium]|nr:hypothetical protein [Pirellulales bacterium]
MPANAAFAELVRGYERTAWLTAWNVLWDYHAAQDATQCAFVEAFRQLDRLGKYIWRPASSRACSARPSRSDTPSQRSWIATGQRRG